MARSRKATGRQSVNANAVNGLTVNAAKGQSGSDARGIASVVYAAKEGNGIGAKATARVKPADVKVATVSAATANGVKLIVMVTVASVPRENGAANVNDREVMPAVRSC